MFFVVGQQAHFAHADVAQDLRADAVFFEVGLVDERAIHVFLLFTFDSRVGHHGRMVRALLGL